MTRYEYIGDGFLLITVLMEGLDVRVVTGNQVRKTKNVLTGRAELKPNDDWSDDEN